jgi:CheY-like chemotaxis protein
MLLPPLEWGDIYFPKDIMTHILLISDTERVKQIFEALEKKDSLQLRTATTLIEADQELSTSAPQFTFVQSRISGFSGEIILRHLKKNLPEGAKIILLAGDAEEMKQAHKHAVLHLDLTLDDEALAQAVQDILDGVGRPREVAAVPRVNPASATHPPKAGLDPKIKPAPKVKRSPKGKEDSKVTRDSNEAEDATASVPVEEAPKKKQTAAPAWQPPVLPQQGSVKAYADEAARKTGETETPSEVEQPADQSQQDGAKDGPQSFAELMRRASAKEGPSASAPFEVEERGDPRAHPEAPRQLGLPAPPDPGETARPVSAAEFASGVPLADAMRRTKKKKRPLRFFALALALIGIPAVYYLVDKMTAAPPESALKPSAISRPAQPPRPLAPGPPAATLETKPTAKPETKPVAKPEIKPVVKPEAKPVAKPEAKPVVKPEAKPEVKPEAKPVLKAGLKSLPAVVSQTKLDETYGKTHPGWQRYIGTRVEFKIFKEAGLYRALQVLARTGEPIPDQLFKRILIEFGGVDSYQVKSTGEKGKYLVEQGVTKGDVALTIYRNKGDRRTKAFVLYYR